MKKGRAPTGPAFCITTLHLEAINSIHQNSKRLIKQYNQSHLFLSDVNIIIMIIIMNRLELREISI